MIEHVLLYNIPAAMSLLPGKMRRLEATAMLLAIGLQESRFTHRRQVHGPARGFWQFESGGVRGVLDHPASQPHAANALLELRYASASTSDVLDSLEHNDTLAAAFARLLLWTAPDPMPARDQVDVAWRIYVDTWRPGKPIRETWASFYSEAWERTVRGGRQLSQMRKA